MDAGLRRNAESPGSRPGLFVDETAPRAVAIPSHKSPERKQGSAPSDVWFSYQFKGLEAACEEAARMVTGLRGKVDAVMGEVPCS
jgi:hypothetical protein